MNEDKKVKIPGINCGPEPLRVNISAKPKPKFGFELEENRIKADKVQDKKQPIKTIKKKEPLIHIDYLDEERTEISTPTITIEDIANEMGIEELSELSKHNREMFTTIRKLTSVNPRRPKKCVSRESQELEFEKCKYDILYFLENYTIIPAPGANIRLLLNDKLRLVARLFEASVPYLFTTSRQSSKTTIVLVCYAWYFNFWNNTAGLLVNLSQPDNKKNIKFIKDIISFLPKYLQVWNPSTNRDDVDNTQEIATPSSSNSKITGIVINDSDPNSTGRGKTGAIYWDEIAYLKGIKEAFAAVSFITNTYAKFAREAGVPAPTSITSTPNEINSPAGEFFYNMWNNSYEMESTKEIEGLLPWEIYEYFESLNVQSIRVFQRWYEFPKRISNPHLIDPNNPDNIIHLLDDIDVSVDVIAEYDQKAAKWLSETRKAVNNDKRTIKKDIYCLFFSSSDSSIFDEDTIDELLRVKGAIRGVMNVEINESMRAKKAAFKLYKNDATYDYKNRNLVISVDPAKSAVGDNLAINIIDFDEDEFVGDMQIKTGKINAISDIINNLHLKLPNAPIIIEDNNFGSAVIERIEEKYHSCFKKLFYYFETDSKGIVDFNKKRIGINTNKGNREEMFTLLMDFVNNKPGKINSHKVIEELITLEYKNNKIQAATGCTDDAVMSFNLYLYCKDTYYKYLNRFFYKKEKFEKGLLSLAVANEMGTMNMEQLDMALVNAQSSAKGNDRDEYERIMGDFARTKQENTFRSPVDLFRNLNF